MKFKHFEIDFDTHSISDSQRINVDILNFIFIPKTPSDILTPSDECLHFPVPVLGPPIHSEVIRRKLDTFTPKLWKY